MRTACSGRRSCPPPWSSTRSSCPTAAATSSRRRPIGRHAVRRGRPGRDGPGGSGDGGGWARCDRDRAAETTPEPGAATRRAPLGLVCGARSGDKGGNANVGLWTRRPDAYGWLREYLDVARFRELLPEAADLEVRRYELPNLCALNFVVVGLLGLGVAASTRPDPQAKGLGEYLRSRYADIPAHLLPD